MLRARRRRSVTAGAGGLHCSRRSRPRAAQRGDACRRPLGVAALGRPPSWAPVTSRTV